MECVQLVAEIWGVKWRRVTIDCEDLAHNPPATRESRRHTARRRDPSRPCSAEMRYRTEHVKRFATGRRQRGIGHRRCVKVKAEIVRQGVAAEDITQQALESATKQNRVMRELIVTPIRSEVHHKQ